MILKSESFFLFHSNSDLILFCNIKALQKQIRQGYYSVFVTRQNTGASKLLD